MKKGYYKNFADSLKLFLFNMAVVRHQNRNYFNIMKVYERCESLITDHAVQIRVLAKDTVLFSEQPSNDRRLTSSCNKQTKQLHL